ncbi:acylamino-acid-releasing enzyme [Trichonephila clavipes]|nr:acylamino-acid-releasing enzyme [Trichonephila clavipes]
MPFTSILPSDLEALHHHSPPEKNKDPKLPLNYRPISLISCIAKLFEKILLSRIQAFSDSNHLIPDFQHGFRKKNFYLSSTTPNWVEGGFGDNFNLSEAVTPSHLKTMWEKSPISHLSNVSAPTLLLLGKKDLRVPMSQGLKYYQLLKARNVPVKVYVYEDNHQLLKTPHDGDSFMQAALWFNKHLCS